MAVAAGAVSGGPWAFHAHPGAWVAVAALGVGVLVADRAAAPAGEPALPGRRRWCLAGALAAAIVALSWPVADLAGHWLLTALLVQRLLLILAAAPLLLLALTPEAMARLTAPRPADRLLEWVTRPVVAVALFTVVVIGTLLPPAVAAQGSSAAVRGAEDGLLLGAGLVLWGPVLRHIPGASRPGPLGVAVYLFVQSVVPTFPAVLYVFAGHPVYPVFAHHAPALGLTALADQRLGGVLSKVATLPVLWSVAWVALGRAYRADRTGRDEDLLQWLDVQRRLDRAERGQVRRRWTAPLPRPGTGTGTKVPPTVYPPGEEPPPPGDGGGG